MNEPLVSVIITTHHEPVDMVKLCLDSLFNQSYKNLEIIVVNDCSIIDGITEFLNYYSKIHDISVFNCIKNLGYARAKNLGWSAATGDYILHADADMYYEVDAIKNMMDHIGDADMIAVPIAKTSINNFENRESEEDLINTLINTMTNGDYHIPYVIYGIGRLIFKSQLTQECGMFDAKAVGYYDTELFFRQQHYLQDHGRTIIIKLRNYNDNSSRIYEWNDTNTSVCNLNSNGIDDMIDNHPNPILKNFIEI